MSTQFVALHGEIFHCVPRYCKSLLTSTYINLFALDLVISDINTSVVKKMLNWQTFNDVLNNNHDLDFQRNNPVFSQGTLACQEMKIGNAQGNGLRF